MVKRNTITWSAKVIYGRILFLCEKEGWTLHRLSEVANIPTSTLYNWRYRAIMPTLEHLIMVCDALNLSIADFFDDKGRYFDELYTAVNNLSEENRLLLIEVAKRMNNN